MKEDEYKFYDFSSKIAMWLYDYWPWGYSKYDLIDARIKEVAHLLGNKQTRDTFVYPYEWVKKRATKATRERGGRHDVSK